MTITLGQLKESEAAIENIINSELPIHISYKISSILTTITSELKRIEDFRKSLIMKYGVQREDAYSVKEENLEEFYAELKVFLDQTVDINIEKFSIKDFPENVKLTPLDCLKLGFLIKE